MCKATVTRGPEKAMLWKRGWKAGGNRKEGHSLGLCLCIMHLEHLPAGVYGLLMHCSGLWRLEDVIRFPGAGIRDSCEQPLTPSPSVMWVLGMQTRSSKRKAGALNC